MCDKTTLENSGTLNSQEMCNKVVGNYSHALDFVPECFMTKKICDEAVNTYPSTIKFVPECL